MMIYLATQWAQKYDVDNDHGDDVVGDDDNNVVDICIYYDEVSVCLYVKNNDHFLLGVSFNHL